MTDKDKKFKLRARYLRWSMAELSSNNPIKNSKTKVTLQNKWSTSRGHKKWLNTSSVLRSANDQENINPNTKDTYPTFGETPLRVTRPIDLSNIKSNSPEWTGEEEEPVHISEIDVSHDLIPRFNHSNASNNSI